MTSCDWSGIQSAPSYSSGWRRSFYVRLKKFLPPLSRLCHTVCEFTSKMVSGRLTLRTRQWPPENFRICRIFVAFSGLFLAYKNEKAHDSSRILNDQSWVFLGALEGTRIPGPLIKSQMLYRLSYERIMIQYTILPNNITTPGQKKQEQNQNSPEVPLYKKCENQYNQSSTHAVRACASERTNSTAGPGDAAGCRRF